MKKLFSRCARLMMLMVALACCVLPEAAKAQSFQGSLAGSVTDPTGAIVPGATMVLTDTARGYEYKALSDKAGHYTFRALDPGTYSLAVTAPTFERFNANGIVISVNENTSLAVKLIAGSVTQTVEVSGGDVVLQTEDATTGATFNEREIEDLPLVGRSIMELTYLSPGVAQAQGQTLNPTGDAGSSVNFTSNGQRNSTAAVYVDGVVVTTGDPNPGIVRQLYTPSVDATQEYHIQQGVFRADTGFSGGTVINIITKSGTNKLHGDVYDFEQNSFLNANTFYNNLNGVRRPTTNLNIYGGVIGGAIRHDKTFFFAVFNGSRSRTSQAYSAGVPSLAERTGDFGALCTAGFTTQGVCQNAAQQLYDPYTYTYNSTLRLPVATKSIPYNNISTYTSLGPPTGSGSPITLPSGPGNLIDPTSAKIFQGFPVPNIAPGSPTYSTQNNYYGVSTGYSANQEIDGRIDNRFSPKDNLAVKFAYGWGNAQPARCFDNVFDPCNNGPNTAYNYQGTVIYTRTLSNTALLSVSGGLIGNRGISKGNEGYFPSFDPVGDLGLPGYIESAGFKNSPRITYSGYTNGKIGATTFQIYNIAFKGEQADAYVDLLLHGHEVKFGGDFRLQQISAYSPGVPAGTFSFTAEGTSMVAVSGGGGTGGDSLASFLIGNTLSGQYLESTIINAQNPDYDVYVQDTWHALNHLTVDAGIRYEVQVPETESSNRISWFDPNASSAIPGYAGQIKFAGTVGDAPRTPFNTSYSNVAPRVGLAYRVGMKTVLRGGYGIFYLPSIGAASGSTSGHSEPWNQYTNTQPFVTEGPNNGSTPYARLSNPFPQGVLSPIGNSPTPLAFVGLAASGAIRNNNKTPYQQTWTFGIQRELPFRSLFNLYYLGTKGTHLYFSGAGVLNKVPKSVEQLSPTAIAALSNSVTNPYYNAVTPPQGCAGFNLVCQTSISQYRLMEAYPIFQGVTTVDAPFGNSHYHSLQAQLGKRFSAGVQFQMSYTFSKSIDDSSQTSGGAAYLSGGSVSVQDPNNLRAERSLSGYDVTHNLVGSYVWELPFGHGRHFGKHLAVPLELVFGGWRTTGFFAFQSGFPLNLVQSAGQPIYTYGPQRPTLTGKLLKNKSFNGLNPYFANPSVVSVTQPYTLGNAPRFDGSVRSNPLRTVAMGVSKSFPLQSLYKGGQFELRLDAFNVFNHPQFGYPATDVVSQGTFGTVTTQLNAPRQVQVAGKVYF